MKAMPLKTITPKKPYYTRFIIGQFNQKQLHILQIIWLWYRLYIQKKYILTKVFLSWNHLHLLENQIQTNLHCKKLKPRSRRNMITMTDKKSCYFIFEETCIDKFFFSLAILYIKLSKWNWFFFFLVLLTHNFLFFIVIHKKAQRLPTVDNQTIYLFGSYYGSNNNYK